MVAELLEMEDSFRIRGGTLAKTKSEGLAPGNLFVSCPPGESFAGGVIILAALLELEDSLRIRGGALAKTKNEGLAPGS